MQMLVEDWTKICEAHRPHTLSLCSKQRRHSMP